MSRPGYVPMDFEYQNGTGQVDQRSPFVQLSNNAQRLGTPFNTGGKKRPFSAFDSPSRPISSSQASSPSKPLPPPPPAAWNSLFNTPRKPRDEIDDSSAGETPKNDSDATPETMGLRSRLSRFDAQSAPDLPASVARERGSPTKERQSPRKEVSFPQAIIGKVKKMCSPGRGEIIKKEQNPDGIGKSVVKRRKRQIDRRIVRNRRHSMSESEADSEYQRSRSPRKTSRQQQDQVDSDRPHWLSSFFGFIASQPMLPHILSWYAQLIFNIFLLGFLGYVIYCVWAAVQGDIDRNSLHEQVKLIADIDACKRQYVDNLCDSPVPLMEAMCKNLASCMKQETKVARASVSAATFAGIYNSFVEEMSWKAIGFTVILMVGTFGFGNLAFGAFRNKAEHGYQSQWQPPPPTPQRTFSGQDNAFYTGTPWHQQPTLEPHPNGGFGQIEGRSSPVRRLAYN